MGRGDRKSKKGKIFRGSYGVVRPKKLETIIIIPKKKKAVVKEAVAEITAVVEKKPTVKKKTAVKKKAVAKKK